ncbi:hypothetical protein CALCODRAFT_490596 [Calocera cornea HHB12733]|uniref:Uncharacterized protein n=1 Tax=Calocera cornea HHB12733 TaxID=1353952 RepID=A0A165JMH1_9BASI|nr:hypothetical protein CALCODRAFT_490596 [Calocera cornea HHB12733]
MVRPKQANPFLTGTGQTPSTSRNPSPRSVGASSRGQRSHSRGRTTNAFQVRRVRLGRDGQKLSSGPDAVQEEDEAAQAAAAAAAAASGAGQGDADSLRSGTSEAPTRASTLNREELERQKYTIKLKTAEVVKPWRSQISQGD